MARFNVGDKVRILGNSVGGDVTQGLKHCHEIGDIGDIILVSPRCTHNGTVTDYKVHSNGFWQWINEGHLGLVERGNEE